MVGITYFDYLAILEVTCRLFFLSHQLFVIDNIRICVVSLSYVLKLPSHMRIGQMTGYYNSV